MSTQKLKPVAFFDIDGTLFRSSLLIALVEKLIEEGIFSAELKDIYRTQLLAWQDREGTYEEYINAVVAAYLQGIRGVHYGEFADVGRRIVSLQGRKVYRYTRDLITSLKADGYVLVAISQSPKTILDEFCASYGFDKVYGRMYEIGPQDRFTGHVIDEHLIQNKATIVHRVFNNMSVDPEQSVAVGDTDGDIPLLESVSRPICFNPNKLLYNQAVRCSWEVVVERKDMIYRL